MFYGLCIAITVYIYTSIQQETLTHNDNYKVRNYSSRLMQTYFGQISLKGKRRLNDNDDLYSARIHQLMVLKARKSFLKPSRLYLSSISGVSWPSGLAYRTQVLVLAAECGFESRPWHLCPWARHLTIIASPHPGVKWVPVRAELVD